MNRSVSTHTWTEKALLWVLLVFTAIAGAGYASFGRHPELFQYIPGQYARQLAAFFSVSFTFFAQGHILLTAAALFVYLIQKSRYAWAPALLAVYGISLASELTGTATGLPFGPYGYTELLGPKWFGLVPLLIPLSWFTMALPAYYLSYRTFPDRQPASRRIGFAALLLTLWDLALDPAMSYLTQYWQWSEEGSYYGMPLINLLGWFLTGLVLMTALYRLNIDRWIEALSLRWMAGYYLLVLLLPVLMNAAGGLWLAVALTMLCVGGCMLLIYNKTRRRPEDDLENEEPAPGLLETEQLNDYFAHHSRSFSFAARFFSPEQYRLVTRLYAFCRTTDDIADIYAMHLGKEEAEKQLDEWERRVRLSYQGIPSGIVWLDELMARSVQSGLPFEIIRSLIEGIRSDLGKVELQDMKALDRYTYQVASVVGIWLCYLFGVREKKVLDRAAALGRAMQITNIVRDVGEDLRMHRLYLPAELLHRHDVEKDELLAMEAGTLQPTESYKILLEDLMERAEADYNYAFRGLSAIPISFARAAAVAASVYKGIHRAVRRNKYNNFRKKVYTRWYEKVILAGMALHRLHKTQQRPFIHANQSFHLASSEVSKNGKRTSPLVLFPILMIFSTGCAVAAAAPAPTENDHLPYSETIEFVYMNHARDETVDRLRTLYLEAVEDQSRLDQAINLIQTLNHRTPIVEAYEAAFTVLSAKHVFWPFKKMRFLEDGLPRLDSLIAMHPDDVEIRYLRLLSCYYLPRFLGRGDTVTQDMNALAALLPSAKKAFPSALYYDMVQFVASHHGIKPEEKYRLSQILSSAPSSNTPETPSKFTDAR